MMTLVPVGAVSVVVAVDGIAWPSLLAKMLL